MGWTAAGHAALTSFPVSLSSQSRMVRNETPYFIWTTRRDVLDCRFLCKDQIINHYARAGAFTTKVGSRGGQPRAPCPVTRGKFSGEGEMRPGV